MKTALKIMLLLAVLIVFSASANAKVNKIYSGLVTVDDDDQFVSIGGSVNNATSALFFSAKENVDRPGWGMVSGVLYNSSHVRFERSSGQKSVQVYWQVVEFDSSASVLRGRNAPGKKVEKSYAIPSINVSSSFIVPGGFTNDGATWNENHYARWRLVNSTVVGLMTSGSSIGAKDFAGWQVITLTGTKTKRGLLNLSVNTTILDINLTVAVNLNRSFATFSYTLSDNARSNGVVSGRMLNSTQLRLSRYGQGISGNLSWEVVELPENNTVYSGYTLFPENVSEINVSIHLNNYSKAIAFSPSGANLGLSAGENNYSSNDVPGHSMFTFNITNSTTMVINRESNNSIAKVGWFLIEFDSNASIAVNSTINLTNTSANLTNSTLNSTNSTFNNTNSSLNLTNSTLNLTNSTINDTNSSSNVTVNLTPSNVSNLTTNSTFNTTSNVSNSTANSTSESSSDLNSGNDAQPATANSRALVINGQSGLEELAKSTSAIQSQPLTAQTPLISVQTPVSKNNPQTSSLTGSVVDGTQINAFASAEKTAGAFTGFATFASSSKPVLASFALIFVVMIVYALTLLGLPEKIKDSIFRKDNAEAPKYRLNLKQVQFNKKEDVVMRKQIKEYVPEQTLELKLRPVHITTTPYNKIILPSKHTALSNSLKLSNDLLKSVKETSKMSVNNDGDYENSPAYLNQHKKTLIEGLSKAYKSDFGGLK